MDPSVVPLQSLIPFTSLTEACLAGKLSYLDPVFRTLRESMGGMFPRETGARQDDYLHVHGS